MKIILSRKGFDTQNGGQASPILPDGTLLSLPIPMKNENLLFSELHYDGKSYLEYIKELNPKSKIQDFYTCHLDPDIRKGINSQGNRASLFGQTGSAQGHLKSQEIKEGDLFLFFGTFKATELNNEGKLKYAKNAKDIHLIYGYFQIGNIYLNLKYLPSQYDYHPHARGKFLKDKNNCIYEATDKLSLLPSLPGAGCLHFNDLLVLTKKGHSKSRWKLPDLFKGVRMSYHTPNSFMDGYFQSAAKGQEFVIEESQDVNNWASNIISMGTSDF